MDLSSLSILQLNMAQLDILLHVCLDEEDLAALGYGLHAQGGCAFTRQTLRWNRLHKDLRGPGAEQLASAIADRLDLRHLETVLATRRACPGKLVKSTSAQAARGTQRTTAPLLWALLTDPRDCAQRAGRLLSLELYHTRLSGTSSAPPAPHTAPLAGTKAPDCGEAQSGHSCRRRSTPPDASA